MKKIVLILLIVFAAGSIASCVGPAQSANPTTAATTATAQATPAGTATVTTTPTETAMESESPALGPLSVQPVVAEAYPALTFEKPLYFTVAGDGSGVAYVVEQTGPDKGFFG